ncbi:hypothetical protein TWF191_001411 [Orbilia oligospora]|uniref:tRNA-guanine(15) transglycosylase-like domain-containing protein n=1 Tax=Orbilia oligospora TaxID=2813651 RepID=A0A7C8QD89_ORBOL|nr:hypothetical protein TWF191_001411 [Orbilia oligospora]
MESWQIPNGIAVETGQNNRGRSKILKPTRWQSHASHSGALDVTTEQHRGGLDLDLRRECVKEMVKRDTPGIAIGGLSGGEEKAKYCAVVRTCTEMLPDMKPRYVMGVGYPEDLVVSVALGADMFDCVWPTRTARFGNAVTSRGTLNLRHASYAADFSPVDEDCDCKETAGAHM